ncbi:hypothetical protein ACFYXQ_30725 [Nocardia jiangxiensis]|uniref:Uncharacterized protein n=1 Tax=Nocardia jiangxiensis TaxID=282685 RepID=A0ABW6SAG1_9NOCA
MHAGRLTGGKPSAEFHITLGDIRSTGIDENGIHLDDPERTADKDGTVYDRCDSYYPSGIKHFGHGLQTTLHTQPGQVPTASPQHACTAAKTMILALRPGLDRLAPVAPTLGQPSLCGKNPCRTVDQIARALPGNWHAGSADGAGPYLCSSGFADAAARTDVLVELRFARDTRMSPDPAQARYQPATVTHGPYPHFDPDSTIPLAELATSHPPHQSHPAHAPPARSAGPMAYPDPQGRGAAARH